jgi:UDPglucose--hexose-1-phosphate uridylyltransferase
MPQLRKDPVNGRWVVFSPERVRRPLFYQAPTLSPQVDPRENPFLEGNETYTTPEVFAFREVGSQPNRPGWRVRVVPNKFPALRVEGDLDKEAVGLYDQMNGIGAHEVIIETPNPEFALEDQPLSGIVEVLMAYRSRMLDLAKDLRFRYILIFKNVGLMAGASIMHPHSQLIAMPVIPKVLRDKLETAKHYYLTKERNIFEDILRNERKSGERVVYENAGYSVLCPFASRFPFETIILPRKQSSDFAQSSDHQLVLLSNALKKILQAYKKGLHSPDYNLILHTAPIRHSNAEEWQTLDVDFRWHMEILPRITGIAGFEFGTGFHINTVLPEEAAKFLREVKTDV